MKPENLRCWTIHIRHLSDIPVSRNWQIRKRKLINMQFCIKVVVLNRSIFNKYATNLKRTISHSILVTWFLSVSCDHYHVTIILWRTDRKNLKVFILARFKIKKKNFRKGLSLCHKLKVSNSNIFDISNLDYNLKS